MISFLLRLHSIKLLEIYVFIPLWKLMTVLTSGLACSASLFIPYFENISQNASEFRIFDKLTPFLLFKLMLHPFCNNKFTILGLFLVTAVSKALMSCLVLNSALAPRSISNSTILISLKCVALINAVSPFRVCKFISAINMIYEKFRKFILF